LGREVMRIGQSALRGQQEGYKEFTFTQLKED